MKENGKLIELLNEREKTLEPNLQIEWTEVGIKSTPEIVISKKFGFIQWLVDNDKIDYKKLREEREDLCDVNLRHLRNKYIDVVSLSYVKLLMLLSISDTPIEDLILYLK